MRITVLTGAGATERAVKTFANQPSHQMMTPHDRLGSF
jgi:hypothetical protein